MAECVKGCWVCFSVLFVCNRFFSGLFQWRYIPAIVGSLMAELLEIEEIKCRYQDDD